MEPTTGINPHDVTSIWSVMLVWGAGLFGLVINWLAAKAKGRASARGWNFLRYILMDDPKSGAMRLGVFAGAMMATYGGGFYDLVVWEYVAEAWANGAGVYDHAARGMAVAVGVGMLSDDYGMKGKAK